MTSNTIRSKSALAEEAVSGYVPRELEILEGIREGFADVEADRTVSHEDAMAEIDAAIKAAT
jgi:predicted transcriptional regulator